MWALCGLIYVVTFGNLLFKRYMARLVLENGQKPKERETCDNEIGLSSMLKLYTLTHALL